MKYKYLEDKRIVICFDKSPQNHMKSLLKLIHDSLCKFGPVKYFIAIDGLESSIDTFVESCSSENYCLYDNGKRNWLVKNFPTLFMLSEEWDDVKTLSDFVGSFNEGTMSLTFLSSHTSVVLAKQSEKDKVFSELKKYSYVEVEILPDGDAFEITASVLGYDFKDIMNWLHKHKATML